MANQQPGLGRQVILENCQELIPAFRNGDRVEILEDVGWRGRDNPGKRDGYPDPSARPEPGPDIGPMFVRSLEDDESTPIPVRACTGRVAAFYYFDRT